MQQQIVKRKNVCIILSFFTLQTNNNFHCCKPYMGSWGHFSIALSRNKFEIAMQHMFSFHCLLLFLFPEKILDKGNCYPGLFLFGRKVWAFLFGFFTNACIFSLLLNRIFLDTMYNSYILHVLCYVTHWIYTFFPGLTVVKILEEFLFSLGHKKVCRKSGTRAKTHQQPAHHRITSYWTRCITIVVCWW